MGRGKQKGGIYPMLHYTSESTEGNREETTGPMLSSGPNGKGKRVQEPYGESVTSGPVCDLRHSVPVCKFLLLVESCLKTLRQAFRLLWETVFLE